MSDALLVQGLHRRFGKTVALHDLSLRVAHGEIVGLLGPNGAGKTTAFQIIAGQLMPHHGIVSLEGKPLRQLPLWRRARLGLGYCPQGTSLVPGLSVMQNIMLGLSQLSTSERRTSAEKLLGGFGILDLAKRQAGVLSGGERRRVELVRAFASKPAVLLVDEPFAGLDPLAVESVSELLQIMARGGAGILFTDHDVRQSLALCHRVYILKNGRRLCAGLPHEVVNAPIACAEYFGNGIDAPLAPTRASDVRTLGEALPQKKAN